MCEFILLEWSIFQSMAPPIAAGAWSTRRCKLSKHDMPEQIARRDRAKDRDALTQTLHGLRHHGREPGLLDLVREPIALARPGPDRPIGAAFLDALSLLEVII